MYNINLVELFMRRVFVKIYGRVQGVNFRNFIYKHATIIGLVGWVKNIGDGTVEAIFEGKEDALVKMIELCRQGPSFALVEDLTEQWSEATGEFRDFVIKY